MQPDAAPIALFVRAAGGSRLKFEFTVNAEHVLLAEHFPGFPIAPGSQVLDFVWRQTSPDPDEAATCWVNAQDVRFQRPFVLGSRFSCTALEVLGDTGLRRRIRVSDETGQICLQATLARADEPDDATLDADD